MILIVALQAMGPWTATLAKTIPLDVEFAQTEPRVLVDTQGNKWYASYWDHIVYKLDPNGRELFRIDGSGNGPGEIVQPYCFTLIDNGRHLLLSHHKGRLSLFDAKNGRFIDQIQSFYPVARLWPWDENHVLALVAPMAVQNHGFELFNLGDRDVVQRWFRLGKPEAAVSSASMAFGMLPDHTIFYQLGTVPWVNVIKPFLDTPKIWRLKPPAGYREPPHEPMPKRYRYSRIKNRAFHNSFTKVKQFKVLRDRFLLVNWQNPGEYQYAYQLYDIESETLIADNLPIKGFLVPSMDGKIYSLERFDPDDFEKEPKDYLHRFELNL